MFRRPDIETIIKEGDQKKLVKAVRKNPDVLMTLIQQENWDAFNKVLAQKPGIVVDRIIRKGDLDTLKRIVEEKPDVLKSYFTQYGYTLASPLHIAAKYDQPAMIGFLVSEKGMNVNKLQSNGWTPLHFAAEYNADEAIRKLVELGANPDVRVNGKTAYNLCSDMDTKEVLQTCIKEREKPAPAPKTKVEDAWKSSLPDEVLHERDLGNYRLTDMFNFTTRIWTRVTENLGNGQTTPETKTFDDATPELIDQARAELDRLTGIAPAVAEPKPEKTKQDYTALKKAAL